MTIVLTLAMDSNGFKSDHLTSHLDTMAINDWVLFTYPEMGSGLSASIFRSESLRALRRYTTAANQIHYPKFFEATQDKSGLMFTRAADAEEFNSDECILEYVVNGVSQIRDCKSINSALHSLASTMLGATVMRASIKTARGEVIIMKYSPTGVKDEREPSPQE